ncbi:MAG: molybdenum cofactor biosynthesis protein B [Candidatus Hadarchaeales archaeon]
MSFEEHRKGAPSRLHIGILVISDTRSRAAKEGKDVDLSGKIVEKKASESGHTTVRRIVPDDSRKIKAGLRALISDRKVDAVITTGGTGIARRDVTIETVTPMFDKDLPGFGEVLRRIGYEKVGTPALLTRTAAGVIKGKPVFCLPGAPNAVEIACGIIMPELGHIVRHARE